MAGFVCYHHCNDMDRPVVSTCYKCGKALCAQCTDIFRSRATGNIVCVECLNNEIATNEVRMANASERLKSEIFRMVLGSGVGFFVALIASSAVPELGLFAFWIFPFLFGSFGLIFQTSFGSHGFLGGAILFVAMALVSPIMFVWRIYKRVEERKSLAEGIAFNQSARAGYMKYLQTARACKSGLSGAEFKNLVLRMEQAKKSGNMTEAANLQQQIDDLKRKEASDAQEILTLREKQEGMFLNMQDLNEQNNLRNRKG